MPRIAAYQAFAAAVRSPPTPATTTTTKKSAELAPAPPRCASKSPAVAAAIEPRDSYSSGSEHEPGSIFLAEMVTEFMEEGKIDQDEAASVKRTSSSKCLLEEELCEVLQSFTACSEQKLLADVLRIKEQAEKSMASDHDDALKRRIMSSLRANGYNAAVCKSRWNSASSISGGEYVYIDVLLQSNVRLIVDIQFSMQFEIARPSAHYLAILSKVPPVFVGSPEQLHEILGILSDAMKLSMQKQNLMLPPWRKPHYLKAKWFSLYRRTTNEVGAHTTAAHDQQQQSEATGSTDWQPPLVNPRTRRPPRRAAGLAKLLSDAGLVQQHNQLVVAM